jgi:hypothetical protein
MPKVFSRVVALTFAGPIMAAQAYVAPANAAIVAPDVLTPGRNGSTASKRRQRCRHPTI